MSNALSFLLLVFIGGSIGALPLYFIGAPTWAWVGVGLITFMQTFKFNVLANVLDNTNLILGGIYELNDTDNNE